MKSFVEFLMESTKGTYVAVRYSPSTSIKLIKRARELNIPNLLNYKDLHTTLIYSTKELKNFSTKPVEKSLQGVLIPDTFNTSSGKRCLVLKLTDPWFATRHKEIMFNHPEANYSFPEYIPHITLSYDIGDFEVPKVFDINFEMMVTSEYVEELKP